MYKLFAILWLFLLVGCYSKPYRAPVVELKWQPQGAHQNIHVVKPGDTLYGVAFHYDEDYRQMARLNHLQYPYSLRVGQVLQIRGKKKSAVKQRYLPVKARPQIHKLPHPPSKLVYKKKLQPRRIAAQTGQSFIWPVKGRIAARFIPQFGKKGIDIAGLKGEKIRAASNGVVAYAGSGLLGYGNLIIIKHDNQFLTAYGNNSRNLVKEGQKVKAGEIIAEIGIVDRSYWGLHFEIRKAGRPVNPLHYLK